MYAPEGSIRSGVNQESDPPGLKTFNGGLIGWIVDLDGSNFTIKNQQTSGLRRRSASSTKRVDIEHLFDRVRVDASPCQCLLLREQRCPSSQSSKAR